MCLYGDDEKLIRVAAMDLGITMSAFIRLAPLTNGFAQMFRQIEFSISGLYE